MGIRMEMGMYMGTGMEVYKSKDRCH